MNANKWNFTKFIQIHNHNIYVCVRAFFIISISIHFSVAILYEPSLKFWMGKISISIPYELLFLLVVFRSHLHLIRKNSFFQVFHGLNDSHSKIWHCCLIFIISIIDVKMLRTFDFGRDIKNSNFIEWPKKIRSTNLRKWVFADWNVWLAAVLATTAPMTAISVVN